MYSKYPMYFLVQDVLSDLKRSFCVIVIDMCTIKKLDSKVGLSRIFKKYPNSIICKNRLNTLALQHSYNCKIFKN